MRRRSVLFLVSLLASLALVPLAWTQTAWTQALDLELVLAVDSSSSVDDREFALQMDGIAQAFRHPAVIRAIAAGTPNGMAVSLVQWSGVETRALALPWTLVRDRLSALALATEIAATPRLVGGGPTALGDAIGYATALIETNAYQAKRRVIDISGDGINNEGELAAIARARAVSLGITVNGLAVLTDEPNLTRYYLAGVVGGPGAFVMAAKDFEDFAQAVRLKLIAEISGGAVSERAIEGPRRAGLEAGVGAGVGAELSAARPTARRGRPPPPPRR